MRCAFIFPGQGAQVVGMGVDVAANFEVARNIFQEADRCLGFSLTDIIREGPEEVLKQTGNTQPAIVATSIAMFEVLREKGYKFELTAGHSVGEFSALYAAGVLSLDSCLDLTRARGEYMQEAGEKFPGTLAAVIGLEVPVVEGICKEASSQGIVVVANLNCPGQVVISGDIKAVEEAGRICSERGAKKVIPLAVSAAFHSPLMDEAAARLAEKLDKVEFSDAKIPIVSNVTAEPVSDGDRIRSLMKRQISSRVLWEKSMRHMLSEGIDTFVEVGPGNALAGMLKRIERKTPVFNFNDMKTLEKLTEKLDPNLIQV